MPGTRTEGRVLFLLKKLKPAQISIEILRAHQKVAKNSNLVVCAKEIFSLYATLFSTTMHFQVATTTNTLRVTIVIVS